MKKSGFVGFCIILSGNLVLSTTRKTLLLKQFNESYSKDEWLGSLLRGASLLSAGQRFNFHVYQKVMNDCFRIVVSMYKLLHCDILYISNFNGWHSLPIIPT